MSCPIRVSAVLLAVAFLFSLSGVANAQASKVVEVAVSGNVNINSETIRNAISLQPGDDYSEQAIEKDREAIMALGYFSAITAHKEDVTGGVKVTYEVTENPKITEIKIIGSDPISPEVILGLMKTKQNQVLNADTLNNDVEAIQAYYGEEGYIAYITEDLGVDPKSGVLTVPILVNRVESVVITGNKKTKSWALLREMKTQPGKIFNVKILKDDIMKIYNLDILEDVKPYQITPGAELGMVKITIPVVEKKTGLVSVGFGYSSRQRLVGQARLAETNFRGRAQGLNLLWQQGTSNAVGGSSSQELGFYEPWIDKRHTSLSVNAYSKLLYRFSSGIFNSGSFANDETYSERHKGGDLTLSRPLTDKTRVYVGGRYENVESNEGLLSNLIGDLDLYRLVMQGKVAAGSVRLVHNTRDFDLDPAAGRYEGVSLEFGSVDGSTFQRNIADPSQFIKVPFDGNYTKGSIDVRRYFSKGGRKVTPQDKRVTLAFRLRAGIASGKLPFFEQFFVGGAESLRGYREDRFWGDNMLLASAELRKPIAQSIAGVVFVDYGSAWGGDPQFFINQMPQSQSFDGFLGTGIGLRVNTPIGHLRLDYGIGSEGSRTHFSMGQAF
ncbi:MAG: BamA/TamA family outer membrane protein [Armatimonadetes bacterium]|nr:BamA/TamA family outer membrane protein [Armatimonadota bacterium]